MEAPLQVARYVGDVLDVFIFADRHCYLFVHPRAGRVYDQHQGFLSVSEHSGEVDYIIHDHSVHEFVFFICHVWGKQQKVLTSVLDRLWVGLDTDHLP